MEISEQQVVEQLRDTPGDSSELYARYAYEYMHMVSLALAISSLERLHYSLVEGEHYDAENSLKVNRRFGAFVPDVKDIYTLPVVISEGDKGYLAVLERSGRPDAHIDSMMEKMIPGYIKDNTPGEVRNATILFWTNHPNVHGEYNLDETISAYLKDEYCTGKLIYGYPFHPSVLSDTGEYELSRGEVSVTDRLNDWYEALKSTLEKTGLLGKHYEDAQEALQRKYEYTTIDEEAWLNSVKLGFHKGLDAMGLPDRKESRCMAALFTASVEGRLQKRSFPEAVRVREMCVNAGFVAQDNDFSFNDLESSCFSIELGEWSGVALQDQHRDYAMFWKNDDETSALKLAVHHWQRNDRHHALYLDVEEIETMDSLLGVFSIVEGNVRAEVIFAEKLDSLKGWNGVLFQTGSAECCLEEELREKGIVLDNKVAKTRSVKL